MLNSTIELIRVGLKTDPTLSIADRSRLVLLLRNHGKQAQPSQTVEAAPKIIRRKQAA